MFNIRVMTMDDYDAVIDLMRRTPGVSFRDADSRESTSKYLERNPGMSFVAEVGAVLCGCIMCGHDGRRGYLQHLVVLPQYRRQGIANALVERCLSSLRIPRHPATQPTNIRPPVPRSSGQAVGAQRRRFALLV
jgi:ribosomal protein S18 acetylase RimI-like enzyme